MKQSPLSAQLLTAATVLSFSLVLLAVACDNGQGQPAGSPGVQSPTGPAGQPTPTEILSPTPLSLEPYVDRNGFRAFAERLDVALRQQDLEFFLDNVAFHGIRCKEPFAPPASCKGLPGDAIVRGIEVGIWQSEGGAIDPEQYEKFISEFLFNLAPGLSDEYGTASPRIYAFGVLREQFRRLPQGVETVEAIIIRIAGPRPYDPIVPGPENQRQALSIGLTFDSARWTIAYLAVGQPDFFLDPQSPNLRQIFQSWQRWIIE